MKVQYNKVQHNKVQHSDDEVQYESNGLHGAA